MVDKVKPLKIETSADGTEVDYLPTESNPTEDYLAAKGIAFENNNSRLIDLNGSGHIQFLDAIETSPVTVRQLRTALNNIFSNSGNGFTATDVQAAIVEARNVVLNTEVSSAVGTSTTSSTDVLMDSMTITPAAGTYLVFFSFTAYSTVPSNTYYISIYSDGTQVAHSQRSRITGTGSQPDSTLATQSVVTVNGSQAIEIMWRTTTGTVNSLARTLNIIRIA